MSDYPERGLVQVNPDGSVTVTVVKARYYIGQDGLTHVMYLPESTTYSTSGEIPKKASASARTVPAQQGAERRVPQPSRTPLRRVGTRH